MSGYGSTMALSDLTTSSVNSALDEFDQLGRDAFLHKYGFGPARSYFVIRAGKHYDSKAVAGAAHGYLPGSDPLLNSEFSGGAATVGRTLEALGFELQRGSYY